MPVQHLPHPHATQTNLGNVEVRLAEARSHVDKARVRVETRLFLKYMENPGRERAEGGRGSVQPKGVPVLFIHPLYPIHTRHPCIILRTYVALFMLSTFPLCYTCSPDQHRSSEALSNASIHQL